MPSKATTDLQPMENWLADTHLVAAVYHRGCYYPHLTTTSSLTPTIATTLAASTTTIVAAIIVVVLVPLPTISIAV